MNLFAAARARSRAPGDPPQCAMTKYIGIRTTSKKTKNSTRSRETNVPSMPTSSSRISPISARAGPVPSSAAGSTRAV